MKSYPLNHYEDNVVSFDYSTLTDSERLATLDNEKKLNDLYERYQPEVGEILYNQQKVLANHNDGVFQQWYESKGFKRWKVYDYINKYQYVLRNSEDPKKIDIFESMPKSLQSEMSKPSAAEEVNQMVYDGNITTHKEYKEQEKIIKEQEERIKELENQKPKTIEKEVEVTPHDYDGLKSDIQQLELSNRQYRKKIEDTEKRNKFIEEEYNELLEQRKEVNEKSKKYDELNAAIQDMQGKMNDGQKQIKAQKDIYDLVRKTNDLIIEVAPLTYLIDAENVLKNEYAQKPIRKIITSLRDMADRLESSVEQDILEGEIVNE